MSYLGVFFFSSRRRHTRWPRDWSSDVCSSDLIGLQTFLDQKWGTRQPITVRDKDFGIVRLRANGKFAFRVKDSVKLLDELVGTQGKYTTDDVTSYLKDLIVSRLTDLLAS